MNLKQLWLNDNPLREVPITLAKCTKIKELDLRNTYIISLPRELADLQHLIYLKLEKCPLKETLGTTYRDGMGSVHIDLQRKNMRKIYKVSQC